MEMAVSTPFPCMALHHYPPVNVMCYQTSIECLISLLMLCVIILTSIECLLISQSMLYVSVSIIYRLSVEEMYNFSLYIRLR